MRRLLRNLARGFGLVVVVIVAAVIGAASALFLTLVPQRGDVRIPGLSAPVDITVDQDGIPRIRAANMRRCGGGARLRACALADVPDGPDAAGGFRAGSRRSPGR